MKTDVKIKRDSNLVMFSGGLDSLTALYITLREAKSPVHVHHLVLDTIECRAEQETIAVESSLAWFRKQGYRFTESTSHHSYGTFNGGFSWDLDYVTFVAGQLCLITKAITTVTLGWARVDNTPDVIERESRGLELLKIYAHNVSISYPVYELTKRQMLELLPTELHSMYWSCRTPANGKRCGKCKTCRTFALEGL